VLAFRLKGIIIIIIIIIIITSWNGGFVPSSVNDPYIGRFSDNLQFSGTIMN
jgi:hypothetical protein